MSDTVSFTELDRQHVELLPARTVLSMFNTGDGGTGGTGTDGRGTFGIKVLGIELPPGAGNGFGTAGANANG